MHVFVFRTTSFFSPTSVECLALPAFLSLIERGTFPLLVVFHGCLITSACSPRPCQHILLFTSTLHRPLLFSIPILSLSLALSLSLSLYLDLYLSFALSLLQLTFPISFPPFSGHSNKSRLYNLSSSHPTASLPLLPSPSLSLPSLIPQYKSGVILIEDEEGQVSRPSPFLLQHHSCGDSCSASCTPYCRSPVSSSMPIGPSTFSGQRPFFRRRVSSVLRCPLFCL